MHPSGTLTYAILFAQAELYLLAQKYDFATEYFEKSISFAPQTPSFHYLSYPTRILGRIAFSHGDVSNAIYYLKRSVDASPNYTIGWYEYAQYLAQNNQVNESISALTHTIQLDNKYWSLMCDEENFAIIKNQVRELYQNILQQMKNGVLEQIKQLPAIIQKIEKHLYNDNYLILKMAAITINQKKYIVQNESDYDEDFF